MRLRLTGVAAAVVACAAMSLAAPAAHATPVTTTTMRPGDTVATVHGDTRTTCTIGLVGHLRRTSTTRIGITAGHCFHVGDAVENDQDTEIGTVLSQQGEGTNKTDLNGYTMIAFGDGVAVSTRTQYGRQVRQPADVTPGASVCHIGVATGLQCGAVTGSVSPSRIDSDANSDHGDSGGPVIQYVGGADNHDASSTFAVVGITVLGGKDKPLSFDPLDNIIRDINATYGPDWAYYYSATSD